MNIGIDFFVVGTKMGFFSEVDQITCSHVTEKDIDGWHQKAVKHCELSVENGSYKLLMLWL